jgi:hypothetical protein
MFGSIASVGYKFFLLLILLPLITKENRLAIGLACLPFFLLYLYIIELVLHSLGDSQFIWILNALITSVIGGIAIIHYLNHYDLKGYWLLISSIFLLFKLALFSLTNFILKVNPCIRWLSFFMAYHILLFISL